MTARKRYCWKVGTYNKVYGPYSSIRKTISAIISSFSQASDTTVAIFEVNSIIKGTKEVVPGDHLVSFNLLEKQKEIYHQFLIDIYTAE